ncbi:hypothetical protein [Kitasatospora terrestris]|uniref:Uncharacterized protein n=1 Tax=Kitasatospora terrestris TaxID=258051 RepID=A0ABP9EEJ6_9ACTN
MDLDSLARTRRALHGVAETLLAGPQYRGPAATIRLRPVPGGFATRTDPPLLVVDGALLTPDGTGHPLAGSTCAELAAAAGITPGGPQGLYADGSGVAPDEPLHVEPACARLIADAFARGDAALREVFPGCDPVLWPEHFDLGVTVAEVNHGVSPGDGFLPEPYAYVGPHTPRTGAFWNAPFGAARRLADLPTRADLTGFFAEGRDLAAGGTSN